jgi:DNA repair protein RecN (Recombination protein N)
MLDEMHIVNVALIQDSLFRPSPGMTAITGETGSGKTALLNALKLLVGERANAGMIREGEEQLRVEGRFFLEEQPDGAEGKHNAIAQGMSESAESVAATFSQTESEASHAEAGETDETSEDGQVVCRQVGSNGRSRVTINGSLAGVKDLAAGVGASIDLCGQHEHQQLLNQTYQRQLFDKWGAHEITPALVRYQEAFSACNAAQAEVNRLEEMSQADTVALDRARFTVEQIDAVAPMQGEYETLLEELPFYENGEMLLQETRSAYQALMAEDGVIEKLEGLQASLGKICAVDASLDSVNQAAKEAYFALEDVGHELARYQSLIDFSEEELEQRQDRLSALQGIMRGYGPTMDEVFSTYNQACQLIESFNSCDELLEAARAARKEVEDALVAAASALSQARGAVVPQFEEAVCAQMARLEMGGAKLKVELTSLDRAHWTKWGSQTLDYMFVPGAGLAAQKLASIASGGEISRVMLALKVVLGNCDSVETLVFDEIDAGVGGKTALALAAVLKDLAKTHQVIVVTHLPQVAVVADLHYLVEKEQQPCLATTICQLSPEERVEEIARMLSGTIDATSLAHARELLSSAHTITA